MNFKIKILIPVLLFLMAGFTASSQNITVSGTVTDSSGDALPGVYVSPQGSDTSTATDLSGKYSISAHPDSLLVFSAIGFSTQIVPILGKTTLDIVLAEEAVDIGDEAIVIGYGSIKKSHLTGSVSKVKNEKLDQIPLARVDDALVGQIAGVTVQQTNPAAGEAPVMRVRGQGSISFDSNPLIVLDGIVVGNDSDFLSSLDMNDIESVEVLKDASSGAIYGSRGANGIILITTKKGIEGPTKFTYHGYVGFKSVPENDYLTTPNDWFDFVRENNEGQLTERLQYVEQFLEDRGTFTDWAKVMYDGGMINSHSLSARGGTKNTKFQTSLSYLGDEGVLLTDNYEKVNFRINLRTQLRDRVQFGLTLNPSHTNQRRFPIGVHDAIRQNAWAPLYLDETTIDYVNRLRENGRWEDAEIGDYAMERMFDDYDLISGTPVAEGEGGTSISSTSNANSLAKVLERNRTKQQTKVYANTFLKFDISDNLYFKQTFGGDFRFTDNSRYIGVEATRNGAGDSESTRATQVRWHTVNESTINYSKESGGHSLSLLGGFAYETWQITETDMEAVGFVDDLIQTIPAPNLVGGEVLKFEEALVSYLSRANYAYNDRYLVSASLRRDGSSKFGPESKYGWFPAISAGWLVNEESFFPENGFISSLKVRASYGITGSNSGIGEYDYLGLIEPVGTGFSQTGYNAINIENPNLRWEKLREINPGIDISMKGEKINLSVDYYQRNSEDLLLNIPIPSVTGFETALVNNGKVKNEGFEVELLTRNITNRNFSWSTTANFTRNVNTLVDFAGADGLISIVDDKRPAEWIALEGNPISSFYGYIAEDNIALENINDPFYPINGQSQDIYVRDINGDGIIDTDDRTLLGSPYPDFVWSIINNIRYKNFDISFMFQGSHGAEVRNISSQYIKNEFSSSQDFVTGFEDADIVEQRIFTSDDIQSAAYVALRNLNIGYKLPTKFLNSANIQGARVYISTQNLFYKWAEDYEGFNPEGIDQGLNNPLTYGYQRGPAPLYRSISLGINLDF